MINLALSLLTAAATYIAIYFALDAGHVWSGIFAAAAFMALNYFLSKRTMNKVTAIMEAAGKTMQTGKFDVAIRTLEGALIYGKWMLLVKSQVLGQIGIIRFLKKDFNAALPNLLKAPYKNWVAVGMLGVVYMKKKEMDKMTKVTDKAVKANSKEPLIWNLYAYCLNKSGERDKAIAVLNRALKKLKSDDRTSGNLKALQNNARMKMKSFGDMWYQFHLETPPMSMRMQAGARGARQGRRIIRR